MGAKKTSTQKDKARAAARKVFKFGPVGIAAMQEVAKEIAADEPAAQDNRPIVACLIPCYKYFHPRMTTAYNMLVDYTRKSGVAKVFCPPSMQASNVVWTRNGLISELIKSKQPFTHILMMDDDMVPQPNDLVKLLAHNVDIVAGLATRRQDPPIPNHRVWDDEQKLYVELWEWPDGLIEVAGVGTGMILFTLNALQKVTDAYFECLFEKQCFGMPDELAAQWKVAREKEFDRDANAWWFRFIAREGGVGEYGEDIFFCHVARMMGLKVHVDTTVQPGHMGDYAFGIKDFLPYRDDMIAKAKAEGRYINPPSLLKAAKSGIVLTND